MRVSSFLERATRLELASRHPTNRLCQAAIRGNPASPPELKPRSARDQVEAASSFGSTAQKNIQPNGWMFFGAGYEARTRYLHLGKVALYQMS